ncbi:MAG TPA: LytR C-terminal domain-containing protein, partial [Solirubrobacteraceae bacterium]|nr:LytR C-terminal domain-containing protein [Solirubrobacteraceae bacterium]
LGGDDEPAREPNTVAAPAPAPGAPARQQTVPRGDVTVAVLNGTTVPGLAAQVGDQLESAGFARGQVTNAADQQRAETTVQFAPDHRAGANEIAGILKVPPPRVRPLDPNTGAIAGPDAEVVVTVGADRTQ